MTELTVTIETWPIRGSFRISRGAKSEAHVVVARLAQKGKIGRGECVPYARYGESVEGVKADIESCSKDIANGMSRLGLQTRLPAGAARNALDCAFWDLEAKLSSQPVWQLASLARPTPLLTAFTLSLASPKEMEEKAKEAAERPLLKLKLAGDDADLERIAAVKKGSPKARLIIDANEGWNFEQLKRLAPQCAELGVALIEQPLPAGEDEALVSYESPVPLCADESLHDSKSLTPCLKRYDAVNIKLDKTGGLTEALSLARKAKEHGLMVMVGCMVGTSLGMAPATMLGAFADFIDLDGPLLLAKDRTPGLTYKGSLMSPPEPALWG